MVTNNAWNSQDPAQVSKGGTGAATLTDHGVLVGSGTSPVTPLAVGTTGQLLVGATGADPAFGASANADFTFTSSTAASTRTLTVTNTDNTSATSHAQILAETGGGSGGDPYVRVSVTGGQDYSFGIDNTSSDALLITDDASPSAGNTLWSMTSAGERTMPLQPSFLAYLASSDANVTGNGTFWQLGSGTALTEVFDQNSDFNTNGTFTAPITGRYALWVGINVQGFTAAALSSTIRLSTSNRAYWGTTIKTPVVAAAPQGRYRLAAITIADMDASDTATAEAYANGEAADTVDVYGEASATTCFGGYLLC